MTKGDARPLWKLHWRQRRQAKEEKFTEFKSLTYKNHHGTATVYGLTADRAGNGWWLLMAQDLIDYSDLKTGNSGEFKLPPEQLVIEGLIPQQKKLYGSTSFQPDFNTSFAWA